ncbi:hypothetical protein KCP73_07010 [Salmonella enterica subsp. enterica]|nr:hypothetical protein KCP73_07010 [Salmonella enterica subsp. enterica]
MLLNSPVSIVVAANAFLHRAGVKSLVSPPQRCRRSSSGFRQRRPPWTQQTRVAADNNAGTSPFAAADTHQRNVLPGLALDSLPMAEKTVDASFSVVNAQFSDRYGNSDFEDSFTAHQRTAAHIAR